MRRLLIDNARRKRRHKRGGLRQRVDLDAAAVATPPPAVDFLDLDAALTRFAAVDSTAAELLKLRYFAGLSIPAAADLLGIVPRSADRLWAYARAWLRDALGGE